VVVIVGMVTLSFIHVNDVASRNSCGTDCFSQIMEKRRTSVSQGVDHHTCIFQLQGRRLYVFKVFIEYPPNLGSDCILMFSVNLTFGETLIMQFCHFFCKNCHFWGYKCVSIQSSIWILSRCIAAG